MNVIYGFMGFSVSPEFVGVSCGEVVGVHPEVLGVNTELAG